MKSIGVIFNILIIIILIVFLKSCYDISENMVISENIEENYITDNSIRPTEFKWEEGKLWARVCNEGNETVNYFVITFYIYNHSWEVTNKKWTNHGQPLNPEECVEVYTYINKDSNYYKVVPKITEVSIRNPNRE